MQIMTNKMHHLLRGRAERVSSGAFYLAWLNAPEGMQHFSVCRDVSLSITRFGLVPQFETDSNDLPVCLLVFNLFMWIKESQAGPACEAKLATTHQLCL